MSEIEELLLSLPREQLWIIGGVVAEVILQIIKRYLWQPRDCEKAKKLLAAAMVTLVLAFGAHPLCSSEFPAGLPDLLATWLAMFLVAMGYHETTDKLGIKQAWSNLVG